MLDKMNQTTGPCPICDKTVRMDASGIIARHECLGTWHIVSTPFFTKADARRFAVAHAGRRGQRWRVIPRRSRWIVQSFRPTDHV